jgi:hypothetical protein
MAAILLNKDDSGRVRRENAQWLIFGEVEKI